METIQRVIEGLKEEQRFFHLFSEEELAILRPLFHVTRCQPGETLIEEGDSAGGPFSIVLSGSLEVKKKTDFGRSLVLAKVTRGALLGHASIFPRNRRFPITAAALEKTEILFMPADRCAEILEQHPTIGVKILKEIIRVQDIRLQELLERFTAMM